jgi:tryptophan-rich sensory protein
MKPVTFIPLLGGTLSSFASKDFSKAPKPPGQPPAWVFGPVWTVLYLLMGYAASLAGTPPIFWIQLALNLIWSPIYTRGYVKEAFGVILALWLSIVLTIKEFARTNKFAAKLLVPYLLWVTYATYLNYSVLQEKK